MNKREHVKKLLDKVGQLLKSDKSESDFWFSPKAGLVEMTRQRSRKSIRSISYQECPYCNGRGVVRSPITIALGVVREISNKLPGLKTRRVCIRINPEIADVLSSKFKSVLDHLKRKNKIEIVFKKDSNCHIEKIEFINWLI